MKLLKLLESNLKSLSKQSFFASFGLFFPSILWLITSLFIFSFFTYSNVEAQDGSGFERLFRSLSTHLAHEDDLIGLGESNGPMDEGETDDPAMDTDVPAGFTFLGQFIDHDIVLISDLVGLPNTEVPDDVLETLTNGRTPIMDLDSVYDGPRDPDSPNGYMKIDKDAIDLGNGLFADDLPRQPEDSHGRELADIGDPRNDENLIISQLHLAFLKFHNQMVDKLLESAAPDADLFEAARQHTIYYYHQILVDDYLPAIIGQNLTDELRTRSNRHYFDAQTDLYMPIEFSTAAFRFGHSQLRNAYHLNSDHQNIPLFQLGGFDRPQSYVDWHYFFDFGNGQSVPSHKLDTKLPHILFDLSIPGVVMDGPTSLAARNLLRGQAFGLPSGQAVARRMAEDGLISASEILETPQDIRTAYNMEELPLWFYILHEANELGQGERLGPVGGRIVGEVLLELAEIHEVSYLNPARTFEPIVRPQAKESGTFTMVDFLHFVETGEATVVLPTPTPTATPTTPSAGIVGLGNRVWEDLNGNGIQNHGEPGRDGVTVHLWSDDDQNGTPDTRIKTAITHNGGYYSFRKLRSEKTYLLQFIAPEGFALTQRDQGSNEGRDSDADTNSGFTDPIYLASGLYDSTYDAGLVASAGGTPTPTPLPSGNASIQIEVSTNKVDADLPNGPTIPVGNQMEWTYLVTNDGAVDLKNVVVTDSQLGEVCVIPSLPVGSSEHCTMGGIAESGQYTNQGTATGEPTDGSLSVTDSDLSHYLGIAPNDCPDMIVEAEQGDLYGRFEIGQDATASGGRYVHVPNGLGSERFINLKDRVRYCVNVPETGIYRLVGNVYAPSGRDNSFFIQVDDQPTNGHYWNLPKNTDYRLDAVNDQDSGTDPVTFLLTAGKHMVTLYLREDGARLDRLELQKADDTSSASASAIASDQVRGNSVYGSVVVENGHSLDLVTEGFTLTLIDAATNGATTHVTTIPGEQGRYHFEQIPTGDYIVALTMPDGYTSLQSTTVEISVHEEALVPVSFDVYTAGVELYLPYINR